jgi:transposase
MDKHAQQPQIEVQDIDHLGIVAGIIDEIGLAEEIDRRVGTHPQEHVSSSQAVKAMILNGLGFVSAPLYLFGEFFSGKATEHLLGEGIKPEHLNDDRLGRVLDKLFEADLTEVFVGIATKAAERFGGPTKSVHLDATSFHLHGRYDDEGKEESEEIRITYGYSREHRPDLKQFVVDLMSTGDGRVPLFLRVANGNEADQAVFAELLRDFRARLDLDALFVADRALSTVRRTWLLWGTCGGCAGCRVRSGKPGGCWPKPRGQHLWRVTFTKATGSPRLKATTPGWCTVG